MLKFSQNAHHTFTFPGRGVGPGCPLGHERHRVTTRDGFELTIYHSHPLRPRSLETPPSQPPVLLIPGLGSNRFSFGLHRKDGLAQVLNGLGRDVWLAELRGSRSSRFVGGGKARLDVDAKLDLDLPALVDFVRAETGSLEVDLVGHSLGGLLALLFAGGPEGGHIGRVATVASPGQFTGLGGFVGSTPLFSALSRGVERFVGGVDRLNVSALAKLGGPLPHFGALGRHFLPGACDAATRRRYLDHAVEDIPGVEFAQIVRWVREGEIVDRHGRSFETRFAHVDASVLVVSATRDKVVPEAASYAAYAKVRGADKQLWRVGRDFGASRDYAHADLLLAPSAKVDVLEPLADWLSQLAKRPLAAPLSDSSADTLRKMPAAQGSAR